MPRFITPDYGTGIIPISRGGTSANNPEDALTALGGIPLSFINAPGGVAGLNQSGGFDEDVLGSSNAATATALANARTINGTAFDGTANITTTRWGVSRNITIGNTTKLFDGSGNIAWSLAEIGATGGGDGSTPLADTNPIVAGTAAPGVGTSAARADHVHPAQTTITGNAGTATTLQTARSINGTSFNGSANITTASWGTARTITIGNTSKSVDGSVNVTWSLAEIGATGGGDVSTPLADTNPIVAGTAAPGVGTSAARADHVHPAQTTITGNAGTATTLQTARTINGTSFDGGANITTASWGTSRTLTIGATGKSVDGSASVTWSLAEIGATNTPLASTTPIAAGTAAPGVGTSAARADHVHPAQTTITGNAGTATALQTARTINGTSFDGSANITTTNWGTSRTITIGATGKNVNGSADVSWTLAEIGATNTPLASTNPIVAGTAAPGVGTTAARADHVHPAQTTITGNAGTATTLQTARTINGTSFDGGANITTTSWGVSRNITIGNTMKPFDGSGNIAWSLAEIGPSGVAISNDVATDGVHYPAFMATNTGTSATIYVSDSNLTYNPFTGTFGAISFNSLSDRRYKTNLCVITDAGDKIEQLAGYTFNYIESGAGSVGVVAQDVLEVMPELVEETDGRLTVNYGGLCALLLQATKELRAEVRELKAQIAGV